MKNQFQHWFAHFPRQCTWKNTSSPFPLGVLINNYIFNMFLSFHFNASRTLNCVLVLSLRGFLHNNRTEGDFLLNKKGWSFFFRLFLYLEDSSLKLTSLPFSLSWCVHALSLRMIVEVLIMRLISINMRLVVIHVKSWFYVEKGKLKGKLTEPMFIRNSWLALTES